MDTTPPRNRVIAFYAALATATLLALAPVLNAYFDRMWRGQVGDNLEAGYVRAEVLQAPEASVDALESALVRARPALQRCYAAISGPDSQPVGRLEVTVSGAQGVVRTSELDDERLGRPALTDCTKDALESLPADAVPGEGARVRVVYGGTWAYAEHAVWEDELVSSGSRPIDRAMAELAEGGRTFFRPIQPADDHSDRGAVIGWNERQNEDPWAERFAEAEEPEGAEPAQGAEPAEGAEGQNGTQAAEATPSPAGSAGPTSPASDEEVSP
ncbi:MAG: hypothetical protein ACFCGT_20870 [Sandaracinaceae bacterium]